MTHEFLEVFFRFMRVELVDEFMFSVFEPEFEFEGLDEEVVIADRLDVLGQAGRETP